MKDGNGVDEESAGGDCHQLEKQQGNKASFHFFLSFLCATMDHVERDGLGSDQFVLCMREHQEVCITKGQRTEDGGQRTGHGTEEKNKREHQKVKGRVWLIHVFAGLYCFPGSHTLSSCTMFPLF